MAPEPLIRASRQPGVARQCRQHVADHRLQRDGGRLQVVAQSRRGRPPWPPHRPSRPATPPAATRRRAARGTPRRSPPATPGLTSTMPHVGSAGAGSRRSPTPPMRAARPARQTGTSAPSPAASLASAAGSGASAPQPAQQPQRRRRIGRPAADAGRHRQVLVQHQMRARRHAGLRRQRPRRTQHQIVGFAGEPRGERPRHLQRQRIRRRGAQRVADPGEHDQAVQQVVAVVPAAGQVQVQVDLGRRRLGQAIRHKPYWPLDHGRLLVRPAASPPASPRRPAPD